MRAVTEQEFNEWKEHPMTRALMAVLAAKREELKQLWEAGSFTDYTREGTALVNVGNLGTCKGYAFVMEFSYESYLTELDDGKQERVGANGGSGADQSV